MQTCFSPNECDRALWRGIIILPLIGKEIQTRSLRLVANDDDLGLSLTDFPGAQTTTRHLTSSSCHQHGHYDTERRAAASGSARRSNLESDSRAFKLRLLRWRRTVFESPHRHACWCARCQSKRRGSCRRMAGKSVCAGRRDHQVRLSAS